MSTFKQGRYKPHNPSKYIGDVNKIVFRSSWEQSFCKFCDLNVNILQWASEEIAIPYIKPTTNRVHQYFPDFYIKYKNKTGQVVQELIEIKPAKQIASPKRRKNKKSSTLVQEQLTYAINVAKWQAAQKWCDERKIKFRILTERELFKC